MDEWARMGRLNLCGTSASDVPLNLLLRVSPRPLDIQIDILSAPRHLLAFLDISLNLEMTPFFATLDSTKLIRNKELAAADRQTDLRRHFRILCIILQCLRTPE